MFDILKLNEACAEQHQMVIEKGFEPQPIATNLMLTVSELSEALEADRKLRHANYEAFERKIPQTKRSIADDSLLYIVNGHVISKQSAQEIYKHEFDQLIKDTFEDEIADAFLRLMDLCGEHGIDIERAIIAKAAYNRMRPPKHGKAY